MNVLSKIVIPQTVLTIAYIQSELEERAREDFFRLKKILTIRRNMYEKPKKVPDKSKVYHTSRPTVSKKVVETTSEIPVKLPAKCVICETLLEDEYNEKERLNQIQELEEYKRLIGKVLQRSKYIDYEGIITADVKEFIRIAEDLKNELEKPPEPTPEPSIRSIPSNTDMDLLCEDCKKALKEKLKLKYFKTLNEKHTQTDFDEKKEDVPQADVKEKQKNVSQNKYEISSKDVETQTEFQEILNDNTASKETVNSQSSTKSKLSIPETDLELGVYESEFKKVTKTVRVKQEDGSVMEEKKVITIKREVSNSDSTIKREPYQKSRTSTKSILYPGSRTIGVVTVKSTDKSDTWKESSIHRHCKSYSQIHNPSSSTSDYNNDYVTTERLRFSSDTILFSDIDFESHSFIANNNGHGTAPSCLNLLHSTQAENESHLVNKTPIFFNQLTSSIRMLNHTFCSNCSLTSNSDKNLLQFLTESNFSSHNPCSVSDHRISKNNILSDYKTKSIPYDINFFDNISNHSNNNQLK